MVGGGRNKPVLNLEEYRARYASEKGYEFWFGEVVRKAGPTWLHSILQILMGELLTKAGYAAGSELELRIDPEWEPRPDIAASLDSEDPYPTKPVDIVAEILSPEDPMHMVFQKCSHYARLGIKQILVLDPHAKTAWEWDRQRENLERVTALDLGNGYRIRLDTDVWPEMDRRHARLKKSS